MKKKETDWEDSDDDDDDSEEEEGECSDTSEDNQEEEDKNEQEEPEPDKMQTDETATDNNPLGISFIHSFQKPGFGFSYEFILKSHYVLFNFINNKTFGK